MITIVVAAESQLLRQLTCEALNRRGGLSVVGTAPDRRRALALIEDVQPDIVVVSMGMAESETLVQGLAAKRAAVVTLGRCDEESAAAVEDGTLDDLVAAIHGAMHGALSPPLPRALELDQLTATERRVLQAVNEGLSNKEIAQLLGVAVPTVKHHVHSLLAKLGVRRRGQAAAIYRRTPGRQSRPSPRWILRPPSLRQP